MTIELPLIATRGLNSVHRDGGAHANSSEPWARWRLISTSRGASRVMVVGPHALVRLCLEGRGRTGQQSDVGGMDSISHRKGSSSTGLISDIARGGIGPKCHIKQIRVV